MLKVINDISSANDKDYVSILVLLDFTKAVSPELLCHKLDNNFGFSEHAVRLIASYLNGQSRRVCLKNVLSDRSDVIMSVPQGLVLGPLLFSLFLNDLPTVLSSCSYHMFADDVQLYTSCRMSEKISMCVCRINED